MLLYTLGYITGLATVLITIYAFFWLILKLFKKVKDTINPNQTKEILKEYLFIWELVEDITTIDELKEKLKTIPSKKLYKKLYFIKEEAQAFKDSVDEISVSDILNSQTLVQSFVENLKHITLYDKNDLKNISKSSCMVWIHKYGFNFHLIFDKDKLIYPIDYPKDNKYKFGYELLCLQDGSMLVYDVQNDIKINVDFEYKSVKLFSNIAFFSNDEINYVVYDLDTNSKIATTTTINPNEYKHLINYSKIELSDYVKLFSTPKNQMDLVNMKLWDEKVLVSKIPDYYADIIENPKSGVIRYDYPVTGDIFDMSVELPIEFKKKNADYLYLGIDINHLVLKDRECL